MLTFILTSAAVIGGIAVGLGLLLALADRFLAEYGECELILNEDKELTVKGGNSLLYTLFEKKYFIPSACGGKGTCAYCKLKVPAGGGPVLPTERLALTDEEIAEGWRLSCQVKVRNDMQVWIPPEYFAIGEYEAVVERSVPVTDNIRELTFRLTDPSRISFRAGQYVQVQAPEPESGEPIYRAYSMSSMPTIKDRISLNVRLEPGGIASTYLHNLSEGDEVKFSGPYGDFLFAHSGRDVTCLATGVGLAPFRSLVPQILQEADDVAVHLFFGARRQQDIYGLEDIEDWKHNERFHYIPILSGEEEQDWGGEWGRLDFVFFDKYFAEHQDDEYYLCGAPPVVNGLTAKLLERGVPENRIHFDKFG